MASRFTVLAVSAAILVSAGCSSSTGKGLKYTPREADPQSIRQQVAAHSAAIKQWADLAEGKTTGDGRPIINLDAQGVTRGYSMRGGWSISGLSDSALQQGYDRIRKALPGGGWKIIKDGTSKLGGGPEIEAEHQGVDHCSLILGLIPPSNGDSAVLDITIGTPIYIAPKSVDLNSSS